jgi:phosphopantetheinyl transferase (holo-ACP synthase)
MTVRACVEIEALSDIERRRAAAEADYFDERENAPMLGLATFAGFVCVKKAVVAAALVAEGAVVRERDIILAHDGRGAPIVQTLPSGAKSALGRLHVSLSHTKDFACGCAAFEKDDAND